MHPFVAFVSLTFASQVEPHDPCCSVCIPCRDAILQWTQFLLRFHKAQEQFQAASGSGGARQDSPGPFAGLSAGQCEAETVVCDVEVINMLDIKKEPDDCMEEGSPEDPDHAASPEVRPCNARSYFALR